MKKIYLAIPYSGSEEESYQIANQIAVKLIDKGYIVFSPITHNHVLSHSGLSTGWDFWKEFDSSFIEWCDEVYVVILDNNGLERLRKSTGIQSEIFIAKELNKNITYIKQYQV